jgi:hypothetical protein
VSTLAQSNAIAPEARSDLTEMSAGCRPRGVPTTWIAVQRVLVRWPVDTVKVWVLL